MVDFQMWHQSGKVRLLWVLACGKDGRHYPVSGHKGSCLRGRQATCVLMELAEYHPSAAAKSRSAGSTTCVELRWSLPVQERRCDPVSCAVYARGHPYHWNGKQSWTLAGQSLGASGC